MGNAAVMGFIPRFRYVLLSDLLLETMTDEQVEAIFAHELGHVMHRHLFWLWPDGNAIFSSSPDPGRWSSMPCNHCRGIPGSGPGSGAGSGIRCRTALLLGVGIAKFALIFGYVSPQIRASGRCIRGANDPKYIRQLRGTDLFRAIGIGSGSWKPDVVRSVLANTAVLDEPGITLAPPPRGYVGRQGAEIFCSALERVAVVNNIPIAARSWCQRQHRQADAIPGISLPRPRRTTRFDRFMSRFTWVLILSLCVFAGWTMLV